MTTATTEAERRYDAQRLSPPPADDSLAAAWAALDADDRLFAAAITGMVNRIPDSHRAMANAGLLLLTCATLELQPDGDGDEDEITAMRLYEVGYAQGKVAGEDSAARAIIAHAQLVERQADDDDDDDEARVLFTDDSRPIRVERVGYGHDRAWLDFTIGEPRDACPHRALVSVDILGGAPGIELVINGHGVDSLADTPLTLADLRQIHADLTALLADDRLLGALAEQVPAHVEAATRRAA